MIKKSKKQKTSIFLVSSATGMYSCISYDQLPQLKNDLEKVIELSSPVFDSRSIFVRLDDDDKIKKYEVNRHIQDRDGIGWETFRETYTPAKLRKLYSE